MSRNTFFVFVHYTFDAASLRQLQAALGRGDEG